MKAIGQGIAMAGLALSAAWLEISDNSATGLWFLLGLWIILADWQCEKTECKCSKEKVDRS